MSNLSLFDIERGLHELLDAWQEAETPEAVAEAEQAIQAYAAAEVRKVDGIRKYLAFCDTMIGAAADEVKAQTARRRMWESRRDRLKTFVFDVMKSFGAKKLECATGSLSIRGNGGLEPLTITDPALVPDELCTVTVEMSAIAWQELLALAGAEKDYASAKVMREPWNALIRTELAKPCHDCEGRGHQRDLVFEEHISPDTLGRWRTLCSSCGGTGKRSVPGCRLSPRGESLVVR